MRTSISRCLQFWVLAAVASRAKGECDQCKFDGNDADDCKVYGQLGDDVLIPWSKASQACLDFYNIKSQSIDPDLLVLMFPSSDGTGGSPSAFVNWLRFESGTVASGVKLGFPSFWDETDTGAVVLLPTISALDGTTVDCEASQSNCYNAIRDFFSVEPGASEMADVGRTLHNLQAFDRDKEQSFARIRLCEEGPNPSTCGALSDQVDSVRAQNPDSFCSAFGLGPRIGTSIPGCEDNDGPAMTPTTSSAMFRPPISFLMSVIVAYMVGYIGLG